LTAGAAVRSHRRPPSRFADAISSDRGWGDRFEGNPPSELLTQRSRTAVAAAAVCRFILLDSLHYDSHGTLWPTEP
jgi:hypothetical protein